MELPALQYQQKTKISDHTKSVNQRAVYEGQDKKFWGDDGFTFGDVIDMLNPLHHLPIISTYYREMTGDECSEGSKIIGDVGFGVLISGVLGVAGAAANTSIRQKTDKNISDHLIDFTSDTYQSLTKVLKPEQEQQELVDKGVVKERINPFFAQTVDASYHNYIAPDRTRQLISSNEKNEVENPFFTQLFDDNNNDYSSTKVSQAKKSGKDWGSV